MPNVHIAWLPKACRTAATRKAVADAVIKAMVSVKEADIAAENLVVRFSESVDVRHRCISRIHRSRVIVTDPLLRAVAGFPAAQGVFRESGPAGATEAGQRGLPQGPIERSTRPPPWPLLVGLELGRFR